MPLTAPVSSLIGQGINALTGTWAQNRQNKANRELAEYSYSKDLEQWNRTNQYNDPSQQMARLKKAGINPNSIYGTSSATGNAGSTTAKYNTPTAQYKRQIDMPQMLGQISQIQQQRAQTNLLNAQTASESFNTDIKEALARNLGYKNTFEDETLDSRIRGQKSSDTGKKWESKFQEYKQKFAKDGISIGQGWQEQVFKEILGWTKELGGGLFNFNR